ncbi:hypothetical protein Scep_016853 [Stephania cephalantha]|uniref:Uncharacterized protein n=1 Tax=Stephania cephalantha TaxID=152367 RepID=A0AAP0INZ6_9MAGN
MDCESFGVSTKAEQVLLKIFEGRDFRCRLRNGGGVVLAATKERESFPTSTNGQSSSKLDAMQRHKQRQQGAVTPPRRQDRSIDDVRFEMAVPRLIQTASPTRPGLEIEVLNRLVAQDFLYIANHNLTPYLHNYGAMDDANFAE